ncbi:glycosyltransferase family 1 protein [Capnocytophaga cynodegmi]|uniref:Glycosyltransferase family 1 protein n=1 Tax=Capnocytophaga cynodegmi TaxID=28189 RepID=A0A250E657_9FLAO|nr:glycosyltransferase family 4 protein [Capnocytophaga cynodegmi]ATA68462.1 glycosyltransferase family 1 protein [Capnocytophaga cynodegmi]
MNTKLIRLSTVPGSLKTLLKGQLRFISEKGFEVIGVSSEGEALQEVALNEGVKVIPIHIARRIALIQDLKSLLHLWILFKKEKPIIVHSITPKAGLLSMLAAKMAGVPIRIHTFTGLIFPNKTGLMQKILILMDQLLCWAATNIYPEGNGVKQDLINYKITSKPLKVIANGNVNGIDLEYFSPSQVSEEQKTELKQQLGIKPNDFVFIFVGRLVGDKGINELIEAFSSLKISDVKLLLVGPMEKELDPLKEKTIKEIETNPSIISVGFQKDVRPYFAISNALAFPSYREGFPNAVIQAGAMELPSIVSNINGCNEIIIDGENGMIIPPKQVDDLQKGMKQLFENKNLYIQLKQNARRMIVERYEQSSVWEATLREYNNHLLHLTHKNPKTLQKSTSIKSF